MKRPPPTAKQIALNALANVQVFGNEQQKREARYLAEWIERAPDLPPIAHKPPTKPATGNYEDIRRPRD